ncbi:MAG: YggS family pyridoxal phosphate-dependent enzyme [Candidatus Hydrogenedentes bacterium]|nr:YggS family pyridoxal phosphate-dependent enzyme [Candidatus Hydrogenedentota bacterium]
MRSRLARNLAHVRAQIEAAAVRSGRTGAEVRLVAVTKTATIEETRALYDLGVREFGENRLEKARAKIEALPGDVRWHMIGPIQRRKARAVVSLFPHIDSVDRLEVAETLQKHSEEQDKTLQVLIEVNVSGEETKHGFDPDRVGQALEHLRPFDRVHVDGLMTMAPFGAPEEVLRSVFRSLRALASEHGLHEVSMGMSDDFRIAVEEGATQVRLGRVLFE